MADIIITIILIVLVGTAILYIRKAKKSGKHCIGCPSSGSCHCNHSDSGCSCDKSDNKICKVWIDDPK